MTKAPVTAVLGGTSGIFFQGCCSDFFTSPLFTWVQPPTITTLPCLPPLHNDLFEHTKKPLSETDYDYIIVEGGLTECVVRLASGIQIRLSVSSSSSKQAVDSSNHPTVKTFPGVFSLIVSDLEWSYPTAPQPNTENQTHAVHAGKALGGGTTMNFGGWR